MDTYHLFLDEILPNQQFKYFCLAGIAVKEEIYTKQIIPEVNNIKKEFFNTTDIILHDRELKRPKKNTEFECLINKDTKIKFWKSIQNLFSDKDFYTFSVNIHEKQLQSLYPGMRDKYFISLQVILENFVNFLQRNNSKGSISIESRNPEQNKQLQKHFHNLVATGTLFYEPIILQEHLGTISFPIKQENIIGLQIADLIPNPLNRELSSMPQKEDGLIELIKQKAYHGSENLKQENRFGIKIIP